MIFTFEAILFDLDGTLVDSAAVVRKVMEKWCMRHGISIDIVMDGYGGERTEDTVARVAPHLCAKSEAALLDNVEGATLEGLIPISGAAEFLKALAPDVWAVVTSSSLRTARPKLSACHLPVPHLLICAESVENGKPHPEPFLKAAMGLGRPPEKCLVFEDAENGVRSALAAGCHVVVLGSQCAVEHERIVGRMTSYEELQWTGDGELRVRGKAIAAFMGGSAGQPE